MQAGASWARRTRGAVQWLDDSGKALGGDRPRLMLKQMGERFLTQNGNWKKSRRRVSGLGGLNDVTHFHGRYRPGIGWTWRSKRWPARMSRWSSEVLTTFQRRLGYLRARLRFCFNPLRLGVCALMRFTNSCVVSSRFSRLGLGLDRTMVASLRLMYRNECAYRWRMPRAYLVLFEGPTRRF